VVLSVRWVDGKVQSAGTYAVTWDGKDSLKHVVSTAGDYTVTLTAVDVSGTTTIRNVNVRVFK
jgi:hypothetical protein